MEEKTRSTCPYCGAENKNLFRFTRGGERKVVCNGCGGTYKIWATLLTEEYGLEGGLLKAIPREKVERVKTAMSKFLKYKGKGGYENTRDIVLSSDIEESVYTIKNAVALVIKGRAEYYGPEFRSVTIYVKHDTVDYEVDSEYTWKQRHWWKGDTLEEKVENYIKNALVEWRTI